jgi:hypothetical protein
MIFDCPTCGAENGVPLSTIDEDGHVLRCRVCGDAFRVYPPSDEEFARDAAEAELARREAEDDPTVAVDVEDAPAWNGPSPSGEVTRELDPGAAPEPTVRASSLAGPGPTAPAVASPAAGLRASAGDPTTAERPLPPTTAELGLDPELDDTGILGQRPERTIAAPDPELERRLPSRVPGLSLPPEPPPASVPGRIEATLPEAPGLTDDEDEDDDGDEARAPSPPPADPTPARASAATPAPTAAPDPAERPRPPRSDQPSVVLRPPLGDRLWTLAHRGAELLNRAPLALKAAIVVFPVAMGLTLLLNPSRPSRAPAAAIPIAPAAATPDAAPNPSPARTAEAPTAPTAPTPEPPPAPPAVPAPPATPSGPSAAFLAADRTAEAGFAYLQGEEVTVRSRPTRRGAAVAELRGGQLVRIYESVAGWTLVHTPPDGAAGFVRSDELGPLPPVGALAREAAFEGCRARRRGDVEACLAAGERQLDACLSSCGGAPPDASGISRCEKVCKTAFQTCQEGCQRRPRSRRRRR